MTASPIELDEILSRYLSDIEFEYEMKHDSDNLNDRSSRILIKRFSENEDIDHQTEERLNGFIEYFTKKKILSFHEYEDYWEKNLQNTTLEPIAVIYLKDPYKEIIHSTYLDVEVLDIDKVRKFRKDYCGENRKVGNKSDPFAIRFVTETQSILNLSGAMYKPNKSEIGVKLGILWKERKERGKQNKSNPIPVKEIAERIFKIKNQTDLVNRTKEVLGFVKSVNHQMKEKNIRLEIKNFNGKLQLTTFEKKDS